jgi:GNAT superfamily N-acetyltransferase
MTTDPRITLDADWNAPDARVVQQHLMAYNQAAVGEDHYTPLHLIAYDEANVVVAGLLGVTYWNWLELNILWLREDLRGQGLGSRLLTMAEAEAIRRGCQRAHLDTFDFQALGFYQKHSYNTFGQLDDQPAGHTRYYLRKMLI